MKTLSLVLLIILSGCAVKDWMFKDGHYIPDNPIEEIGEAILEAKTGVNIDFTPGTPEGK